MPFLAGIVFLLIILAIIKYIYNFIINIPTSFWYISGAVVIGIVVFLAVLGFLSAALESEEDKKNRIKRRTEMRRLNNVRLESERIRHANLIESQRLEKINREKLPDGFIVSVSYRFTKGEEFIQGVAVDSRNQKIAIWRNRSWSVFLFSDLISCDAEITEGNTAQTTSSRSLMGAAVGGIAFGPVGAIIGGSGKSTKTAFQRNIQKLVIRLGFRDILNPVYEIQFGARVTDDEINSFREWIGRFNAIIAYGPNSE